MFYTYSQNNSGGSFDGVQYVVIEADSTSQADTIAEDRADVYFNGCDYGRDCSCCGDRWYPASSYDASDKPEVYGQDLTLPRDEFLETYKKELSEFAWHSFDVDVYYGDGTKYELRIPIEELQALKEKHILEQDSRWGFCIYPSWSEPSDVTQVFNREHGPWYDLEGNFSLEVDEEASDDIISGLDEYGRYQWYGRDKDKIEAFYKKFLIEFNDVKDSLRQAIDDSPCSPIMKELFTAKIGYNND